MPRPAEVPDVVEDGATLLDNARLKAQALVAATGLAAVADDTGLEVDALGARPACTPPATPGRVSPTPTTWPSCSSSSTRCPTAAAPRAARFRTVALVAFPDGTELWAEGVVEGTIARRPGGIGGFGYDPVFVPARGRRPHVRRDDPGARSTPSRTEGRAFRSPWRPQLADRSPNSGAQPASR